MTTLVQSKQLYVPMQGYIDGLTASNNVSDSTNDIDFGAGVAWVNDRLVVNNSSITKQLDALWAAGTNQGGRFAGSKTSSTWYHCFIMRNLTTNAVDFGFDTSVSGANKPSGWEVRRIWSVQTTSGNAIRQFTQVGDICHWKASTFYTTTTIGASARLLVVLTVPIDIQVEPLVGFFYVGSNSDYIYLTSPLPNQADETADYTQGRIHLQCNSVAPLGTVRLLTNTSAQIGLREALGTASNQIWILVSGYIDSRGRR